VKIRVRGVGSASALLRAHYCAAIGIMVRRRSDCPPGGMADGAVVNPRSEAVSGFIRWLRWHRNRPFLAASAARAGCLASCVAAVGRAIRTDHGHYPADLRCCSMRLNSRSLGTDTIRFRTRGDLPH
jgi:hypothetical protein